MPIETPSHSQHSGNPPQREEPLSLDGSGSTTKPGTCDEEDEDAYRLSVYGYVEGKEGSKSHPLDIRSKRRGNPKDVGKPFRRFSKKLSRSLSRRRSSVVESLPDTPRGWAILSCVTMSAILSYEMRLQKSLTKPPVTFSQLPSGSILRKIYQQMTEPPSPVHGAKRSTPSTKILSRSIQPSLFVGTRGMISSTAAYLHHGPSSSKLKFVRFRENFRMSQDGAQIAVDWEFQRDTIEGSDSLQPSRESILRGTIHQPVVIIMHGINNDTSFGYMKSLSRSFCNRGYISASMNFRGCGGLDMATPRGYNAAYTGDIRSLVRQISVRLGENVGLFIVGNSLGANIMTKYLGEEGMMGTLPSCVSGAASLGNPLLIDSGIVRFPFNVLMALGVKKIYLENLKTIRGLNDARSKEILKEGFLAPTISAFDNAVAPSMIRNNPMYPYETKIGYENGDAYWFDASSYRYIQHVSIPFLSITARDDFLVSQPSRNKLGYCLGNPNVMIVETRCGGHLGWQETPPDSAFGSSSWADAATSDFFDAIRKIQKESSEGNSTNPSKDTFAYSEPFDFHKMTLKSNLNRLKAEALAYNGKNAISKL